MKTYTTLRNTTAKYCNVSTNDSAKMSLIDANINDSIRTMCNLQGGKLRFLEATKNMFTVANQQAYQIPNGFRKLIDLYVYSGSGSSTDTIYSPEMVFDPTKWKTILQYRFGSQSVPYFTYVENTRFFIQPIPSVSGNLIVLRGRIQTYDLSIADYTTGSIVSVVNGATTVTGTGTSWTSGMAGLYIMIPRSNAANAGDGQWYKVDSVTSGTVLELEKPYEGTSISAATQSYTLGQVSAIPSAYDIGIVYRATALYWQNNGDAVRAKVYWLQYDGGNEAGYSDVYGGLVGQMLANEGETEEGTYVPPYASTINTPLAPYYWPYQDASGFN